MTSDDIDRDYIVACSELGQTTVEYDVARSKLNAAKKKVRTLADRYFAVKAAEAGFEVLQGAFVRSDLPQPCNPAITDNDF